MNEALKFLVRLQELDTQILEKQIFIEKVPERVQEVNLPLRDASDELDRILKKKESLLREKRDREKELEDINDKIKKMKSRMNEIKTNKEYQAHLKEIESMEKKISDIEEKILLVMEELDSLGKREHVEREKVSVEEKKISSIKKELHDESDIYEKALSSLKEERNEVTKFLKPEIYNLYMSVLDTGGGVAVCKAEREICFGCNMNMPPQLFVEVRKNEEILQCPQCRRILYMPEKIN